MVTLIIRVLKHINDMCVVMGNAFGNEVIAKGFAFGYKKAPTRDLHASNYIRL
jgi:hypothetical protein